MTRYEQLQTQLRNSPQTWLVTGVAGFIGSHLLETLLKLDQRVVGLDNFATGHQRNLDEVESLVTANQWANFNFIRGDIRNIADCQSAMNWRPPVGAIPLHLYAEEQSRVASKASTTEVCASIPVTHVLHQAALGSVPRSLADPLTTNDTNITGFLNMLVAARDAKVRSFTYAASSSSYGDHPALPKVEENIGNPLSPYAVTKYVNELYAAVFARSYGFKTIGLRYFNVFGPRQDPNGAYAAVIPKWTEALLKGEPVYINGDGKTSRDFCYVANAIQANLLAAMSADLFVSCESRQSADPLEVPLDQVFNIAVGERNSLSDLFSLLRDRLLRQDMPEEILHCLAAAQPTYRDFREGDVRHSQADIGKAKRLLGYAPTHALLDGIDLVVPWYVNNCGLS